MPALRTVEDIGKLLEVSAQHDDGEPVDLLTHGLQCAGLLAAWAPQDLELQVAGLVHDLGLVVAPDAAGAHAAIGAALVADVLGARVAWLVAQHVDAKCYLVANDPAYAQRLSARSVETLAMQGGAGLDARLDALARSPDRAAALSLRRADDAAKVPDVVTPGLARWLPMLEQVAQN